MPERPPIPFEAIPILGGLKPEDRAALSPLCEQHAFEKDEVIFRDRDPAQGSTSSFRRMKIVKAGKDRDIIMEILGPGEPVGAVAVFERRPFPATAVALEPSVISSPERDFFALIEKRPRSTRLIRQALRRATHRDRI